jgi:galactoside O-acetyltransferase
MTGRQNLADVLPLRRIGADVQIWPRAHVVRPEAVAFGDSVIIDDFVFLDGGQRADVGSFVHIASFTTIAGGGVLEMGDFAGLSGGVRLYTGNEDYSGGCLTNPAVPAPYRVPIRGRVRIGAHAIVGANAVILPDVHIGEGAVVGANSLVTRDCEPWTIYAGSPAKPIKARPSERIRALEAELRADLYDGAGRYVPRAVRDAA